MSLIRQALLSQELELLIQALYLEGQMEHMIALPINFSSIIIKYFVAMGLEFIKVAVL